MPDLHEPDLDRAFAALTSDLTRHSGAPGADAAIAAARARRRTRSGAVALVAAAAVAAVAVPQVLGGGDDGSVAGRADLPAAAALSPALLTDATSGWTGAWEDMEESDAAKLAGVDANCLDELGGPDAQPTRLGDRVFVSDREEVAIAIFIDYEGKPAAVDGYAAAFSQGMDACGATVSTSTHGDAVVAQGSAGGDSGADVDEVWFARSGDRVALFAVLGTTSPAPDDATDALTDLVLGAIQDDSSFEVSSGALELQVDTGSSSTTPNSFRDIPLARIREATGDWSRDWTNASSDELTNRPCFPASWPETSSWGQGSSVGDRGTLWFAGTDEAAAEIEKLTDTLAACQRVRWTVHAGLGAANTSAWASYDGGSIFLAERGKAVAALQVQGLDIPSDEIALRVVDLLELTLSSPQSATKFATSCEDCHER